MNASCQKSLSLYSTEIDDQVIDLPIELSLQIFISGKKYLELKCEIGYWQSLHKRAILRKKSSSKQYKEQEG